MDLLDGLKAQYSTILLNSPWSSPWCRRARMTPTELTELPISKLAASNCHLFIRAPNGRLPDAIKLMGSWHFTLRSTIIWLKVGSDGLPHARSSGSHLPSATELLLIGTRSNAKPGTIPIEDGLLSTPETLQGRLPEELYKLIQNASPAPYLEFFAAAEMTGWDQWRNRRSKKRRPRKTPMAHRNRKEKP